MKSEAETISETGNREPESLKGKFCRLPWARSWVKIVNVSQDQSVIWVRHRGRSVCLRLVPGMEIRDKKGALAS